MKNRNTGPMLQAVIAAALFGASAPLSKLLLAEIAPTLMASFLYLGSGIGLYLHRYVQRYFHRLDERFSDEASLTRNDWPWIMGAVLVGGIVAPIVLMFGLKNTLASTASLLLNFEGVATTVIAVVVFKEAVGKRIWMSVLFIRAMRELGSARTCALFGTAPFVGAALSLPLFRESQGTLFFLSLPIMMIGAVFLLKEDHEHLHKHETTEHEHRHNHKDSHHTHGHSDNEIPKDGYHSHVHEHEFIIHEHQHTPGIYHRHAH